MASRDAEDWRGEAAIRSKPLSAKERRIRSTSLAASIAHKRRAAKGENMAAMGGPWAKTLRRWQRQYATELRGGEA